MKKFGILLILLFLIIGVSHGDDSYQSSQNFDNFDEKGAIKGIDELQSNVDNITKQLFELDAEARDGSGSSLSDKYRETRAEIVRVINDINKTSKNVLNTLQKISLYKDQIKLTAQEIKDTKVGLSDTEEYISQFTNFMYKLDNEFYTNSDTIDEYKLLLKSDNIPRTLVGESLVKSMLLQFNDLMGNLDNSQKDKLNKINKLNILKIIAKNDIKGYQQELDNLQQKKNYLVRFIDLYKNKEIKNQSFYDVLTTRKDVYDATMLFIDDIANKKYKISSEIGDKINKFNKEFDQSEKETTPLARPIYPIEKIEMFFDDKSFEKQYGIPNQGIQINAKQSTPVYSSRDGVVYHVADTDGLGINWIMIYHMRGYVTVYMYLNHIDVKEGDIVKRGQLIGYSGGEPGTKGAGFISNGPNLTYQVFKDGIAYDPLNLLDLSVVQNKDILPETYRIKYLNDKYARPIDITNVKFATGDTVNARANNFLMAYGVGAYQELAFREDVVADTNIDRDVAICIGFAESTLGKYLTTDNNIGNVGNNDRGDRIGFNSILAGARMISLTLNNQYLGNYHTIKQLSRYGNKDGKIYASSPINRQTNVLKCLSQIKGYYVPEDYPFRTGPNPNMWDYVNGEKIEIMSGSTVVRVGTDLSK